ncbi:MAG: heme exporter protein [Abditibacteriota bacterium]|nr:heme exporter protein [Abditibacteriota bacterium]
MQNETGSAEMETLTVAEGAHRSTSSSPASFASSLQCSAVGKRFGTRVVMRDVSFEVKSGEVVAVVGRNGAGKSTLLRLVAGLTRPTVGSIRWLEEGTQHSDNLGWRCGLCAPDAPLYRELTVGENLEFWAQMRGAVSREELQAFLERFQLRTRWNDLAGELSSGLRARLQLAVATWHRPSVLLLDEPGANLDEAGRTLLREIVDEQRVRGVTLLATNDAREAELADRRVEL